MALISSAAGRGSIKIQRRTDGATVRVLSGGTNAKFWRGTLFSGQQRTRLGFEPESNHALAHLRWSGAEESSAAPARRKASARSASPRMAFV